MNVIPTLLEKHPNANFAFSASRSIDISTSQRLTEGLEENQRYRIYKNYIRKKIGNDKFTHFDYPKYSSYLLVNNVTHKVRKKEREIVRMFAETYDSLPDPPHIV